MKIPLKIPRIVNPFEIVDATIRKRAERMVREVLIAKQESRAAIADYQHDYNYRMGVNEETEEDYVAAYRRCIWIYACAQTIMQSGAGLNMHVFKGRGDKKEEVTLDDDREMWDFLDHPNPDETRYDLMEATWGCRELTGDAYWEISRGETSKRIRVVNWLFPQRMKIIPAREGGIDHYEYTVSGSPILYKPEEILHFKYWNPKSKCYGMSPMKAIAGSALTLFFYQLAYEKEFFKKGAKLSAFATLPKDALLSDESFRRLRDQLRDMYGGVTKSHEVGLFEGGLELKEYGTKPVELGLQDLRKATLEDVLVAYQVPASKFNLIENPSYATSQQQEKGYWHDTMLPKIRKTQDTLNRLLTQFNPEYYCEFDLSGIEALRENEKELAGRRVLYVKNRIKTVNEVRAEMGLEPVDWGDEPPPASGGGSPFGLAASADIKKKDRLNWKEWAEEARKYENRLFSLLKLEFERMQKDVLKRLKEKVKKATPPPVEAILFDLDAEGKLLISAVSVLLQDAAQFFGDNGLARMQLGLSFDLYDPAALEMLRKNIEAYFGKKGVAMTLRTALAEQLKEGYKLGESMKQMAERVNQVFKPYTLGSAGKARMIARSETIRAANGATLSAWKQSGVVTGKRWFPAGDACDYCLARAAMGVIPLDKEWHLDKVGDKVDPHDDTDIPPLHTNCRCSMEAET